MVITLTSSSSMCKGLVPRLCNVHCINSSVEVFRLIGWLSVKSADACAQILPFFMRYGQEHHPNQIRV